MGKGHGKLTIRDLFAYIRNTQVNHAIAAEFLSEITP